MPDILSPQEKDQLLKLAREALEKGVRREPLPPLDLSQQSPCLQEPGATFVTLTRKRELRGCIGAIDAYQPLAQDVREHAVAAALSDYRFPPVQPEELPEIVIEISRLTPPQPLAYETPAELMQYLRPGVDGVVLRDKSRRATFLPQVWEKLPTPELFLEHLCHKMGADPNYWRHKKLEVFVYQVEEFHEG